MGCGVPFGGWAEFYCKCRLSHTCNSLKFEMSNFLLLPEIILAVVMYRLAFLHMSTENNNFALGILFTKGINFFHHSTLDEGSLQSLFVIFLMNFIEKRTRNFLISI